MINKAYSRELNERNPQPYKTVIDGETMYFTNKNSAEYNFVECSEVCNSSELFKFNGSEYLSIDYCYNGDRTALKPFKDDCDLLIQVSAYQEQKNGIKSAYAAIKRGIRNQESDTFSIKGAWQELVTLEMELEKQMNGIRKQIEGINQVKAIYQIYETNQLMKEWEK